MLARRASWFAAVLLPVLTGFASDQPLSSKEKAEQRIAAIETRLGGRLGVVAVDMATGGRLERRADERFPMCSTFKLLAAAAVLDRVDKKQEQLTRLIPYTKADLLDYAPITKQHVGEGGMTIGALCAAALEYSDNTAANLLLKTIGGPDGYTLYARSLRDTETRLDRVEPELNSALPGDERDTTSPAAMTADLQSLLIGEALSQESREQLNTWLAANTTGDEMIRGGLPRDWKVGDKTGRGSNGATNDIAILRPPGKPPIFLAVYYVGSAAPRKELLNAIAQVARIVAKSF